MNHQNRPFSRCPCNRFSRTLVGIGRKRSEERPGNDPCMRRNDNTGARRPKAPKVDDVVRHLTQRILKARAGWRGHARPPDSCVAASHSWWPCCDVHRGSHHTTEPRGAQAVKKQRIAFAFTLTYLWVMLILLGSILFDTLVLYPNIFHDVPRSLETA